MIDTVKAANRIRLTTSASRWAFGVFERVHLVFLISVLVVCSGFVAASWFLPVAHESSGVISGRKTLRSSNMLEVAEWDVIRGNAVTNVTTLATGQPKRFRLAGVFVEYGENVQSRRAILDDLVTGRQHLVRENDDLGGVTVVSVAGDRVVIQRSGVEETLWLGFSGAKGTNIVVGVGAVSGTTGVTDRYGGRRIGEGRWVFSRDKLTAYYQELLDNPERLLKVFDSLKPIYGSDRRINGYYLDVEGEAEFFAAAGLVPGDRILKVNALPMSSRARAEMQIRNFVEGRSSLFVFEMQRAGETRKHSYEIR